MLIHPQFDPVAFHLGPLSVHWYGLSYLLAFLCFAYAARKRLHHPDMRALNASSKGGLFQVADVDDLLFYGVWGVILGGRLGYVLFYQPWYYGQHPLEIFAIWQGGMSFHGGMVGVIAALVLWARKKQCSFWVIADWVAPVIPLGLLCGRWGNFVNGELWGRVASPDWPLAMIFPQVDMQPRHPSQLYQLSLEGVLLFIVLWLMAKQVKRPWGSLSAAFLMGYGFLRFMVEYYREPDAPLGLLWGGLSMGQWLSVPMMILGLVLWRRAYSSALRVSR